MRALLIVAALLATVAAQESPPEVGEVAPAAPAATPRPAPPDKHLAAVIAEIAAGPHAFDGQLTWGPQQGAGPVLPPVDCSFTGGVAIDDDGELRWHALRNWTVLQRGERGATRLVDDASASDEPHDSGWQDPQGDAPEVPLSPRLLLEQLPHAQLGRPEPAEVDGRPALRVLATWRGKAAKAAAMALAVPSSQHEQLLDALATVASRDQQSCTVCAEIRYDPATRRWLAATMRLLLIDGRPLPPGEPPPPTPDGLPAPTGRPMVELIVTLRRRDPAELPPPALDGRARELLRPR